MPSLDFVPCPDAGETAEGTGSALVGLAAEGVIRLARTDDGDLVLNVVDEACRPYRKLLFGQCVETAQVIYGAATSWRARSATAAKTLARARESSRAMSTVGTLNLCHRLPGAVSCAAFTRN